jgi:hypothetical protein
MRLPRDVGGRDLASLLVEFSHAITRPSGSHLRLTSVAEGHVHQLRCAGLAGTVCARSLGDLRHP